MIYCVCMVCVLKGMGHMYNDLGTRSFLAMLLSGRTTPVFYMDHSSTCCEAGGLV